MGYIIVAAILIVLIVASWFGLRRLELDSGYGNSPRPFPNSWRYGIVGGLTLILVVFTVLNSYTQVDTGHVGVQYQFGKIQNGTVPPGVHWIAPWNDVTVVNVQTQKKQFDNLPSFTSESQEVGMTVTVNYQVNAADVNVLLRSVGSDWYDKLVPPRINQDVKDTTVQYSATQLGPNRDEVKKKILDKLNKDLNPYSIQVSDVNIDNIKYSDSFTQAIEAKQTATQQALQAQAKVKQAEAEAQQQVATARGQATANHILASSLSPEVLRSRALDNQAAMINQLANLNKQAQVVYVPNTLLGIGNLPVTPTTKP